MQSFGDSAENGAKVPKFPRNLRKLSELEKQSIKVLSQGAALRFLLTRVFDALNTVEGAMVKVKDPIEYLKRLEFHKNAKNHEDYFF